MTIQNLLVELFVEELPPRALQKLGNAFAEALYKSLSDQGLTEPGHPSFYLGAFCITEAFGSFGEQCSFDRTTTPGKDKTHAC